MNKWMWWNWSILQIVAGRKRGISTSVRPKYRFYESYWPFLMLEDTLIFLFDCVFHRRRKRKGSFKLMRRKHRRFHKERIQKQTHLAGRGSQGHAELEEWHKPVAASCSAAGRRTLVPRAERFWSFCIGIRFLHLQRPWKRMSNSSVCARVCVC